jgi:hypothetical protein
MPLPVRLLGTCSACRSRILRQIVRSTASPFVQAHARGSLLRGHPYNGRPFSSFAPLREENKGEVAVHKSAQSTTEDVNEDIGPEVPWYLEVEPPRHPTLVPLPQHIPDVPENSPRLIGPLLKFASEDLGLDELNLLDLRELDPPAALGPQLFMLFGTARSYRHLHVSADRLVRWCRQHGVGATADGLLGRHELKVKLRRKARKAKLMGNSRPAMEDDGITTSWICVNLGTLGSSSEETPVTSPDGILMGFSSLNPGATIVVQMFTEAKRKEMDLETLWSRSLARSQTRNADAEEEETALPWPATNSTKMRSQGRSSSRASGIGGQRPRYFSTFSDFPATHHQDTSTANLFSVLLAENTNVSQSLSRQDGVVKRQLLERIKYRLAKDLTELGMAENAGHTRLRVLAALDQSSPYSRLWNLALKNMPTEETWPFRAWWYATGLMARHPHYGLTGLQDLISEISVLGHNVARCDYIMLLKALFHKSYRSYHATNKQDFPLRTAIAAELMDIMHERGQPIIANDIILPIMEALSEDSDPDSEGLRAFLEELVRQVRLPYPGEEALMRLLEIHAKNGDWNRFWVTWRVPPRFQQSRSPKMYICLYNIMAATKHQSRCIDAIRWCFMEMMNENTPVRPVGAVLEALMRCIRVADPRAEHTLRTLRQAEASGEGMQLEYEQRRLVQGEFVRLLYHLPLYAKGSMPRSEPAWMRAAPEPDHWSSSDNYQESDALLALSSEAGMLGDLSAGKDAEAKKGHGPVDANDSWFMPRKGSPAKSPPQTQVAVGQDDKETSTGWSDRHRPYWHPLPLEHDASRRPVKGAENPAATTQESH